MSYHRQFRSLLCACGIFLSLINNNNNEYLEHLTRTGPKHLHVLYKYIFVKLQCIQHECTHTHAHTHSLTCTRTHTHTPVAYQGNETEEKIFKKRKVFKEDLKELTGVEWRTETGSWFHVRGIVLLLLPSTL